MASKGNVIRTSFAHEELQPNSMAKGGHFEAKETNDIYATDLGVEVDPATDRRLFWKISSRILVIQVITYFLQSLDEGILNYASIVGIKTVAHLVGQDVNLSQPFHPLLPGR
jgi:hypothetical protein